MTTPARHLIRGKETPELTGAATAADINFI